MRKNDAGDFGSYSGHGMILQIIAMGHTLNICLKCVVQGVHVDICRTCDAHRPL